KKATLRWLCKVLRRTSLGDQFQTFLTTYLVCRSSFGDVVTATVQILRCHMRLSYPLFGGFFTYF
ncbi:MAG: hypothetical protein Q8Q84_00630, partial [Hydrogenophaga sp.]|nr:hypothetical protein [Hydrogenophaga sp.]